MSTKLNLFPYPILNTNIDDYIDSKFDLDVNYEVSENNLKFKIEIDLDNGEIIEGIKNQKYKLIVQMYCGSTSLRRKIEIEDLSQVREVIIPESDLIGKVLLQGFLVANRDIKEFTNSNFHEDYGDIRFEIDKGMKLGVTNIIQFTIKKNKEELGDIPSVFSIIKRSADSKEPVVYELGEDKIIIQLNTEEFNNYYMYANSMEYKDIVNSIIIYPALLYVLDYIKNNYDESSSDDLTDRTWFLSIEHRLKELKMIDSDGVLDLYTFDKYDSFEMAQKILDFPISNALDLLSNIGGMEE